MLLTPLTGFTSNNAPSVSAMGLRKASVPFAGAQKAESSKPEPESVDSEKPFPKLSVLRRFGAFFSNDNLDVGFNKARESFQTSPRKGLEVLSLLGEVACTLLSGTLLIPFYMAFPGAMFSNVLKAFAEGVHEHAAAKLVKKPVAKQKAAPPATA